MAPVDLPSSLLFLLRAPVSLPSSLLFLLMAPVDLPSSLLFLLKALSLPTSLVSLRKFYAACLPTYVLSGALVSLSSSTYSVVLAY